MLRILSVALAIALSSTVVAHYTDTSGNKFQFVMGGLSKLYDLKMELEKGLCPCLRVEPPEHINKIMFKCINMSMSSHNMFQEMASFNFSSLDMMPNFLENFTHFREDVTICMVENLNVTYTNISISLNTFVSNLRLEDWRGTVKDLTAFTNILTRCAQEATGDNTNQTLTSFFKCKYYKVIEHCQMQGRPSGILPAVMTQLLALDDVSKCASVMVPDEIKTAAMECLKSAAAGVSITEGITSEVSFFKKLQMLAEGFLQKIMIPAIRCADSNLTINVYNETTRKLNAANILTYVAQMQGWENITPERQMVIDGFVECAKVFMQDVPAQETEIEIFKRILMQKIAFNKCYIPKFTKTCGVNNDLTTFFFQEYDYNFTIAEIEAFMHAGGAEVQGIITSIKDYVKHFLDLLVGPH